MIRSALAFLVLSAICTAQTASPLARHYTEGEKLTYHMKGSNDGWDYEVLATGTVKKDARGHFVEEYAWSDFKSNGSMTLSPASLVFRQTLSLDPAMPPSVPNLSQVQTFLIGPITDMLTFYADLWMAARQSTLTRAGDHAYVKLGGPSSWADGNYVILGEDSIDFDLTLKDLDTANQMVTLLVKHVPPAQPKVNLPAPWMQAPVADTPNNWVNVTKIDLNKDAGKKNTAGKYHAEVGKETFDVEIKVGLKDGKILSATLDNPVNARQRDCSDASLLDCGEATPRQIHRHIEIQSAPQP
jgi:hypothetical protein